MKGTRDSQSECELSDRNSRNRNFSVGFGKILYFLVEKISEFDYPFFRYIMISLIEQSSN